MSSLVARGLALAVFAMALPALAGPADDAVIDGVVRDEQGRAAAGADVLVRSSIGAFRRAAVADGEGRFAVVCPPGQTVEVVAVTSGGAVAAAAVLTLSSGERVSVEFRGRELVAISRGNVAAVGGLTAVAPRSGLGAAPPLARRRDLESLLSTLPGGVDAAPGLGGPGLLGVGPGELRLVLDGIDLGDPVDGTVPLELPLALFEGVEAEADLSSAVDAPSGGAVLRLTSDSTASRRSGGGVRLGGDLRTAARTPADAFEGGPASAGARAELRLARAFGGAGHPVVLRAAPLVSPGGGDPTSFRRPRAFRRSALPLLARGRYGAGFWDFSGTGLLVASQTTFGRSARIAALDEPARTKQSLIALGGQARRSLGAAPAELALTVSYVESDRDETDLAARSVETSGGRWSLSLVGTGGGRLAGRHLFRGGAGIEAAFADRSGLPPRLRPLEMAPGLASASQVAPWLALDDRWEPLRFLEVAGGLRAEGRWLTGRPDRLEAEARRLTLAPAVAPHAQVRAAHARTGLSISGGGGHHLRSVQLEPFLRGLDLPTRVPDEPRDQAIFARLTWQRPWGAASATALERRTLTALDDRSSPATGRLEVFDPPEVRRVYRALILAGDARVGGGRLGAAYVLSRLEGNHVGFWDAAAGAVRPGATADFDTTDVETNRDGPLPLDRRHAVRAFFERSFNFAGFNLRGGIGGRVASGGPESALARSGTSGDGQTFVLPRGSLGRTPWTGSLDAVAAAARSVAGARLTLTLEAFNLTNHRPVTATDPVFTDQIVTPRSESAGDAASALDQVRTPGGDRPLANPRFGAPISYADPLLVRLLVGVEF